MCLYIETDTCSLFHFSDSTQVRWHAPLDHQCPAKTGSTAQPPGSGNPKPHPHSITTQSTGVQMGGANHRHLDPNNGYVLCVQQTSPVLFA